MNCRGRLNFPNWSNFFTPLDSPFLYRTLLSMQDFLKLRKTMITFHKTLVFFYWKLHKDEFKVEAVHNVLCRVCLLFSADISVYSDRLRLCEASCAESRKRIWKFNETANLKSISATTRRPCWACTTREMLPALPTYVLSLNYLN